MITPIAERETIYEVVALSDSRWKALKAKKAELLNNEWIEASELETYIANKDPEALLLLASMAVKQRYRFDEYYDEFESTIELIRLLTKSNIAVPDHYGELNYHLEEDFYLESKVNLLIYFAQQYKNYTWNEGKGHFENSTLTVRTPDEIDQYFELLFSEDNETALDAYILLTQEDPMRIGSMADEFRKAGKRPNYGLPQFPFKFLKQLSLLTDYCDKEGIYYWGSRELQSKIKELKADISLAERRRLEDEFVDYLSLETVTAFEYWSFLNQKSWQYGFSAARILDKFYSKNWKELVSDPKQLKHYLFRALRYDQLGIVGYCNNYLKKFIDSDDSIIQALSALDFEHPHMEIQRKKALELAQKKIEFKEDNKKVTRLEKRCFTNESTSQYSDVMRPIRKIYLFVCNFDAVLRK